LRSLASRRDLPSRLDLANVMEEIEDAGRSRVHAATSLARLILGSPGKRLGASSFTGIAPSFCGSRQLAQ
jgi:hypothetical protein